MAYFHTTVLDNQIKALPTVSTASGSIATFDTDLTENLVSVKCQIVAKQASGTPSPDNPLPITTYTEMTMTHSGKNLFDLKQYCADNNISYTEDNGVITFNANLAMYNNPFVFSDTDIAVTLSAFSIGGTSGNIRFQLLDSSDNIVATMRPSTPTVTGIGCKIRLDYSTGGTVIVNKPVCYTNGTTANIPFGQTVANGVLDVTTGKLRVTHRYVKPATDFELQNGVFTSRYDVSGIKQAETTSSTNLIIKNCNMFNSIGVKYRSEVTDGTIAKVVGANNQIACFSTAYTDVADFNTRVIQQGLLEIVYEYATPIEIQLDSTQLTALLNENNIWCDTGDTEVKYLLTVGKKIS